MDSYIFLNCTRSMNCHDESCAPSMLASSQKLTTEDVFKKRCVKIINMLEVARIIRKFGYRFGGKMPSNAMNEWIRFFNLFRFARLGMSWLSSRMISTSALSPAVLECLKASAIGLGDGNCDDAFSCDLNMIKQQRKLRRRKRSLDKYVFRWNI